MHHAVRLLRWPHVEHRIPVLLQRGGPVRIAVHHLLHQGVAARLQSTPQAVAAVASQLIEASKAMLDEHGRGAIPGRLIGHATQDVIIVYSESVDCRGLVVTPE